MKIKKLFQTKIILLVIIVVGVVYFVSPHLYNLFYKQNDNNSTHEIQNPINPPPNQAIPPRNVDVKSANIGDNAQTYNKTSSTSEGFADLVGFVNPSVVNITSIKIVKTQGNDIPLEAIDPAFRELFQNLLPQQAPKKQRFVGIGTGFVVRSDGFIITNNHVVQESEKVQVTFENGDKYEAKIYATDPVTDLALLKIDAKDLKSLKLGDSDKVRVGDLVIAIGNPYGLGGTVSSGIISAKSRNINLGSFADYLQTDAAINKGNSGGPMINTKGEVIGINTAIFSNTGGSIGIGFALPSNTISNVLAQLITNKYVIRSWLGVQIQEIDENIAKALGLDNTNGALVASVVKDSPAATAGMKTGDIILSINNNPIKNSKLLPQIISNIAPETTITLGILSDNKNKDIAVVLKAVPKNTAEKKDKSHNNPEKETGAKAKEQTYDSIGLKVAEINDSLRKFFDLPANSKGVIIIAVRNNSILKQKNIGAGLKILEVNQQKVETIEQLDKLINSPKHDSWLFLLEMPNGSKFFIPISKKEVEQGYPD